MHLPQVHYLLFTFTKKFIWLGHMFRYKRTKCYLWSYLDLQKLGNYWKSTTKLTRNFSSSPLQLFNKEVVFKQTGCRNLLFNKVAGLQPANVKNTFFTEQSGKLILKITYYKRFCNIGPQYNSKDNIFQLHYWLLPSPYFVGFKFMSCLRVLVKVTLHIYFEICLQISLDHSVAKKETDMCKKQM